ncbi:MAG TPA: hypothetical protein VER98_03405, partial [Terriglobia bacterium]|nr:hypothetical protein [Terriglobia bacterium]
MRIIKVVVLFFLGFFSHAVFAASSLSVSPASGYRGASLNLTISGSVFVPGQTQVSFVSPRVLVNGVRVTGASSLVANVTLLADPGPQTISVVSGGMSNTASFEILPGPVSNSQSAKVSYFTGPVSFVGSRDARGTDARFASPAGIWSDGMNLYVTDSGAHTFRRISPDRGDVATLAGAPFQPGSADGIEPDPRFIGPADIWGDGANVYFVEDCTIRKFAFATAEVKTFVGVPNDCAVVDGNADVARLRLNSNFITGDGAFLYVINGPVCTGTTGSSCVGGPFLPGFIRVVSRGTGEVSSIPMPPGGTLTALFSLDGYLYTFWDSRAGWLRIGRINLATREHEFLFNSKDACCDFLPAGLWFDGKGSFYFIENLTVRRFVLATGEISSMATLPAAESSNSPSDLWGAGDDLYVTDAKASIVSRVHIPTGAVSLVAGQYIPPFPPVTDPMAFSDGVVPSDRVRVSAAWSDGEFIYGASGHAIYKVRIADGQITHIAGAFGLAGSVDGTGNQARFSILTGIWGDGTYLYALQGGYTSGVTFTAAVRRINLATREVSTFATIQPAEFSPNLPGLFDIWGDGRYLYVTDQLA